MTKPVGEHRLVICPQMATRGVKEAVVERWDIQEEASHIFVERDERSPLAGSEAFS